MSLVLEFGDAGHRRTELDLPWYVNGTLDALARERVERHLAVCSRCRQDEREERWLQECLASAASGPKTASSTPDNFAALRRRIEGARSAVPRERERLGGATWMRWAMAAQVFALALLSAWVLRGELREGSYRTLGADRALPAASVAGSHRALLVFEPGLAQERMRSLLQANGARIVDGPNDAGAWLVLLPDSHPAQALQALRSASGVALAESVDPEPAR